MARLGLASTSAVDEARVTQEVQRLAAEIVPNSAIHKIQVHQDRRGLERLGALFTARRHLAFRGP